MTHYRLIVDLSDYVSEEGARAAAAEISEIGYLEDAEANEVDVDSVVVEKVDD